MSEKSVSSMRVLIIALITVGMTCCAPRQTGNIPAANPKPADNPEVMNCVVLVESGDFDKAREVCKKAVASDPDSDVAHAYYAKVLAHDGDTSTAVAEYRRAVEIKPDAIETRTALAEMLRSSGDIPEAISTYREILKIRPEYKKAHLDLAQIYIDRKDYLSAAGEYDAAIATSPQDENLYLEEMKLYLLAGRVKSAGHVLEKALANVTDPVSIRSRYAAILQRSGYVSAAIEQYRTICRISPGYSGAEYNLANALYRNEELNEAEAVLLKHMKHSKPSFKTLILLGKVYTRQKNYTGAAVQFREAIHLNSRDEQAHILLGDVLRRSGDKDGAVSEYRAALRLNSHNKEAKKKLKRLIGGRSRDWK